MNETLVMGLGPVGRAVMEALVARGDRLRVAQRSQPKELPTGVGFTPCDVLDCEAVRRAIEGASQLVLAIGFPYDGKLWRTAWPAAMRNVVAAAEAAGTRVVFVDDMYMLGPQDAPLTEDMPLTDQGVKPAVRAEVTRIWQAAAAAGRLKLAALRCPDFYGPGVGLSHIGDAGFGRLAQGKPAFLIAPPDMPHDFAYVPDIARAVLSLLDAPDDVYGQAWNMPCAPTRTPREILALGAAALGVAPKVRALPLAVLPLLGLAVPMLREIAEMRFLFDRPYRVDARKFAARFWSDVTPFEVGAPAAARSFR
ncbi:Epimerase [Beijerinckiaceae bacterium RH AL1]|nr:NAD-dependent epimerase/dehydratase family protein [Beijerinckiaceae bacterium]VVB47102.1 Epimerase [Beijerinckiaceae bacterium RH CH11]VVB47185.1 Epimerase [Beijerinckiaceae bacterium RH AL8]VVC55716.1 Epimerase [Beijerinckiaceae bacterium RH AL1]